jgi:hypothetical protein
MEIIFANRVSKSKRDLITRAAEFTKRELFPRTKDVIVEFTMVKDLNEQEGVFGDVFESDDRWYDIRLDEDMDDIELVSTVIHEMVHVKQYAKNEMKQLKGFKTRFNRKVYDKDTSYEDRPWEQEATDLENLLYLEFVADAK